MGNGGVLFWIGWVYAVWTCIMKYLVGDPVDAFSLSAGLMTAGLIVMMLER